MGEEAKKKCGGGFKKFCLAVVLLAVAAYGGWFAYAKTSNRSDW